MWFAIAAFLFVLSLPGLPEQIRDLAELVGMSGYEWRWWNYAGVSIGLILMFLFAYPLWRRLLRVAVDGGTTFDLGEIVKPILSLLFLGGALAFVVYVFFIQEQPKRVWTHPTYSVAEQEKAKAECRMRATEVYRNRLRNWNEHARYEADCLIAKGFQSRKDGEE